MTINVQTYPGDRYCLAEPVFDTNMCRQRMVENHDKEQLKKAPDVIELVKLSKETN